MLDTRVERVDQTHPGGLFRVRTPQGTLWARQVVVATGPFQEPRIPQVCSRLATSVTQLHSSAYRNPHDVPAGRSLVVGAGNSGLQIALELAGSAGPTGSREIHVAAGSKQTMVAQRPLGRDLFWWLTKSGFLRRPATSPLARLFRRRGGDLVIGTSWNDVHTAGITVHPRVATAGGRSVEFADGTVLEDVAAVVWATGFQSAYAWLVIPDVWNGTAVSHSRGRTSTAGLWFIGLSWQHTRGSALLVFVDDDAAWISDQLAVQTAQ
jgi:putative flavoprotein involved in K+ transport